MTLERRTQLRRGTKGLKRGKGLNPMSNKRRDDLPRRKKEREAVFARDRVCVVRRYVGVTLENPETGETTKVPPCRGELTFGHVKKASQMGAYDRKNGVAQCWFHNCVWVETAPRWAVEKLGMVPSRGA